MPKKSKRIKGIYLRGNTFWYAKQVKGKRIFISLHTSDESEAISRAAQTKGEATFKAGESFDSDFLRYESAKQSIDSHTARTQEWMKTVMRQFSAYVSNKPAHLVTEADVAGFYREIRKRLTENGARSYMRAVSSFFGWTRQTKMRFDNPVKAIKFGKASQPARTLFATKEQRDLLIEQAPNEHLKFILYCAFFAGMRFNEICEARPDWFNLDGGYVLIQKTVTFIPKNKKNRSVPLSPRFKAFLETYGKKSPFMLHPQVTHGSARYRYDFALPWNRHMEAVAKNLNKELVKSGKRASADFSWITPHVARHTFASILAQNGESIYKIAKWLGDTTEVTEKHYAHLAPGDTAIAALD